MSRVRSFVGSPVVLSELVSLGPVSVVLAGRELDARLLFIDRTGAPWLLAAGSRVELAKWGAARGLYVYPSLEALSLCREAPAYIHLYLRAIAVPLTRDALAFDLPTPTGVDKSSS